MEPNARKTSILSINIDISNTSSAYSVLDFLDVENIESFYLTSSAQFLAYNQVKLRRNSVLTKPLTCNGHKWNPRNLLYERFR